MVNVKLQYTEALDRIEQKFGCDMAYYGLQNERDLFKYLIDDYFDSVEDKVELTEKECHDALSKIENEFDGDMARHGLEMERDLLKHLITEYFNNPPLKTMEPGKKECKEALSDMCMHCMEREDFPICDYRYRGTWCKKYDVLFKLIDKHFDNPSMQWEELDLYKPYWDNKENTWCYFARLSKKMRTGVYIAIGEFPFTYAFKFEENRFFRKEVKDSGN